MAGGPFITDKKKEQIVKLYNSTTLSQYEIADALRISQCSVSRVLKEYKNEVRNEMGTDNPSSS